MKNEIKLRIILQKPPADVDYGLQFGHAKKYEIVQRQRATGGDLSFEFVVSTKAGIESTVDFSGLFVQGRIGGRFVYINIGGYAGEIHSHWNRRLKIPLSGITRSQIDQILETNGVLETFVPGTGKDGSPACATVKPFAGWFATDCK